MVYYTERIKKVRKGKKINQKEMGEALGMHQTQYSRYELGKNAMTVELFRKICIVLNTDANYLLGLKDDPKSLK